MKTANWVVVFWCAIVVGAFGFVLLRKLEPFTSESSRALPPEARASGYHSPVFWGGGFVGGK